MKSICSPQVDLARGTKCHVSVLFFISQPHKLFYSLIFCETDEFWMQLRGTTRQVTSCGWVQTAGGPKSHLWLARREWQREPSRFFPNEHLWMVRAWVMKMETQTMTPCSYVIMHTNHQKLKIAKDAKKNFTHTAIISTHLTVWQMKGSWSCVCVCVCVCVCTCVWLFKSLIDQIKGTGERPVTESEIHSCSFAPNPSRQQDFAIRPGRISSFAPCQSSILDNWLLEGHKGDKM